MESGFDALEQERVVFFFMRSNNICIHDPEIESHFSPSEDDSELNFWQILDRQTFDR
ncbi:hypothetical protein DSUL_60006 [Desulfovibrionales bacterium]